MFYSMCEKRKWGDSTHGFPSTHYFSPPLWTHPTTPTDSLAVQDKEVAANWPLNLPVCPFAHSKTATGTSKNVRGTPLTFTSKELNFKIPYTFPADIPTEQQFGTGLIFPEPPAAISIKCYRLSWEHWPAGLEHYIIQIVSKKVKKK